MLEIIDDPIYLTEPELISKSFQPDPNPMSPVGPPCVAGYKGVPEGKVPHYLPGTNPSIDELTKFYGIPREATLGGAETMYPEFRKKTKTSSCGRRSARRTAVRRLRPRPRLFPRLGEPGSTLATRLSCEILNQDCDMSATRRFTGAESCGWAMRLVC